jgi:SepF-like predicted cell division protein (DUF552 family)
MVMAVMAGQIEPALLALMEQVAAVLVVMADIPPVQAKPTDLAEVG